MNKIWIFLIASLLVFLLISCGGDKKEASTTATSSEPSEELTANDASTTDKPTNRRGQLIFKQYCVICHGADGKLGISGAKDLSVSILSKEERIGQVTNGKGLMTPYKDILSAEQIEAVVDYLEELR